MQKDFAKVLVISHNVFGNTTNMGRTLANFFANYPSDCLAQLYFHAQQPTLDFCENYYCVTDFDVLTKRKKYTGRVFGINDIKKEFKTDYIDKAIQTEIYQIGRKRKPYMYLGRNLLWDTKRWKNQKLLNWIDAFNPQIIFFASGDYSFAYKVAIEISEYKKIPILTYVCDEYYFLKRKSVSPLYWLSRIQRNKAMKRLFEKNKQIVTISDSLSEDYSKEFGVTGNTVMTGSVMVGKGELSFAPRDTVNISYIGNLDLNRYKVLMEIGKILKKLYNGEVLIDVYSTETRMQILNNMTEENGIRFCGSIPYNEVINVMKNSDILLHVESMDEENRERVKYSVSTKIADSLASGACLFAYGPKEVASIQYLIKNECAVVATNHNEMKIRLQEIIESYEKRRNYAKRGIEIAEKNHSIEKNSKQITRIIDEILI